MRAVLSATHATFAGRAGSEIALVQLDELGERRDRVPGTAFDLGRAGRVAEDEEMRRRAVDEPERHARVHRVDERALAFDEEELAPARAPSTTSRSAAPARKSATTASTAIPQPAIAMPGLTGRHEDGREPAPARLEVELDGDRLLADRAVRPDREHDARRRPRGSPRSAR